MMPKRTHVSWPQSMRTHMALRFHHSCGRICSTVVGGRSQGAELVPCGCHNQDDKRFKRRRVSIVLSACQRLRFFHVESPGAGLLDEDKIIMSSEPKLHFRSRGCHKSHIWSKP